MWLFTKYGFFSVVCPKDEDGNVQQHLMMVRARVKRHLINLMKAAGRPSQKILVTDEADYAFRVILLRDEWSEILLTLDDEVRYSNFKDACHKNAELEDEYIRALTQVWVLMSQLQPWAPRFPKFKANANPIHKMTSKGKVYSVLPKKKRKSK